MMQAPPPAPRRRIPAWPFVLVGLVGLAAIAALFLRLVVYRSFKIPSASMYPTLALGQRFDVNQLSRTAERGDIVVFPYPEHPEQDFVKRVVAADGERFEVKNGHPWINGWEVPSCLVGKASYDDPDDMIVHHEGDVYVEFLGTHAYLIFIDGPTGSLARNEGPFQTRAGEVWVIGDNRNNSHDSRTWWAGMGGGVRREAVKGKIVAPHEQPHLPDQWQPSLGASLATCLAARPSTTVPPPQ